MDIAVLRIAKTMAFYTLNVLSLRNLCNVLAKVDTRVNLLEITKRIIIPDLSCLLCEKENYSFIHD